MFIPAMIQHVPGEHADIEAPGPPTKQDAPEMHPDMIVDDPVRGTGIPTEGAVGMIHLDGCLVSINGVGLFGGDPGHGGRVDEPVKTNILLLPIQGVIAVYGVPVTVHQAPDSQHGSVFLMMGHPNDHGEGGLHQLLRILQSLGFLLSPFSDGLHEPVFVEDIVFLTIFPAHVRPWSG